MSFTFRSFELAVGRPTCSDPSCQSRLTARQCAFDVDAHTGVRSGPYIDNINPTLRFHHNAADVRELPTDEAYDIRRPAKHWRRSCRECRDPRATRVREPRRVVGLRSRRSANVSAHLDGAVEEQWVKFDPRRGTGYRDEAGWTRQVANVADASRAGSPRRCDDESPDRHADRAAARYGWLRLCWHHADGPVVRPRLPHGEVGNATSAPLEADGGAACGRRAFKHGACGGESPDGAKPAHRESGETLQAALGAFPSGLVGPVAMCMRSSLRAASSFSPRSHPLSG